MIISKKGRQRGCRSVYLKWSGDYMKKYEFHLRNWLQSFVACYIWSKPIFGNTAPLSHPLFMHPPVPPPFHIRDPKVEISEFSPFLWSDLLFIGAYRTLPPLFAPPFFIFEKSKMSSTNFVFIIFR